MAKVLIDIPDEIWESIKHVEHNSYAELIILKATKNGTPIPKGCGRLIDAKALEDAMYHEAFEVDSDMQRWDSGNWIRYKMFENAIHNAPAIIEADKEVQDE